LTKTFLSACVTSSLGMKCARSSKCSGIPKLENGELLKAGEAAGFEVMVTSDQNIVYQQNLAGRKLALVVLGSNIWPIVRDYGATIAAKVDVATPGSYNFIEMPLPPKPQKKDG
jgi:hypothetical protein